MAFTLLEMLVSFAVLAIILVALASLAGMISRSYRSTMGNLDSFEAARTAFDHLARTLSQATLMSYLGFDDPASPTAYELKSDLHFFSGPKSALGLSGTGHAVFFQAPFGSGTAPALQGTDTLLAATGFYVAYGDDPVLPAALDGKVENRRRYRLFQYAPPRERMRVYEQTLAIHDGVIGSDGNFKGPDWFKSDVEQGEFCHPLAENIVFLALLPIFDGKVAASYTWNSRDGANSATHHRLPHSLRVVLVVIDEASAARLPASEAAPEIVPDGLFVETADYEDDMEKLEKTLADFQPRLNYRIFTAEIGLGASNSSL